MSDPRPPGDSSPCYRRCGRSGQGFPGKMFENSRTFLSHQVAPALAQRMVTRSPITVHNVPTLDVTHVMYACFTSAAQSIEGGSLEVTLHQLASHLSLHLLQGFGPPPPDCEHEPRRLLQ